MSDKIKNANKNNLDFDKDICPLLTAASENRENCRSDCAWYDMERNECAVMGINVQLKIMNDSLHQK